MLSLLHCSMNLLKFCPGSVLAFMLLACTRPSSCLLQVILHFLLDSGTRESSVSGSVLFPQHTVAIGGCDPPHPLAVQLEGLGTRREDIWKWRALLFLVERSSAQNAAMCYFGPGRRMTLRPRELNRCPQAEDGDGAIAPHCAQCQFPRHLPTTRLPLRHWPFSHAHCP